MNRAYLLLLIVFSLTAGFAAAQGKEPDDEAGSLKGKVQKVETFISDFLISDGVQVEKRRSLRSQMLFNPSGKLLTLTRFSGGGQIHDQYTFQYDGKARKTGWEFISSYSKNTTPSRLIYTFDARGNVGKSVFTNGAPEGEKGFTKTELYKYDTRGNRIEKTEQLTENITFITAYVYDRRNKLIEKRFYDSRNDASPIKDQYVYSVKGQLIEETETSGKFTSKKYRYAYNEQNDLIEKTFYHYAPKPDPNAEREPPEPPPVRGAEHLKECEPLPEKHCETKTVYEYVYDSQGNWTKRIERRHLPEGKIVPVESRERIIIYYPN
jgi:YD repeat-containing protein